MGGAHQPNGTSQNALEREEMALALLLGSCQLYRPGHACQFHAAGRQRTTRSRRADQRRASDAPNRPGTYQSQGIDYMIPILGSDEGGFNYTRSVDQKLFEISADGKTNATQWKQICDAAVASG